MIAMQLDQKELLFKCNRNFNNKNKYTNIIIATTRALVLKVKVM